MSFLKSRRFSSGNMRLSSYGKFPTHEKEAPFLGKTSDFDCFGASGQT
jgi:hypothetical protein